MLRDTEVQGDPSSYSVPKPSLPEKKWFTECKRRPFAKSMTPINCALLLLQNLPVEMSTSQVNGQRWHRVVVGPFTRKLDAERARTKLREQDLPAILMRSKS